MIPVFSFGSQSPFLLPKRDIDFPLLDYSVGYADTNSVGERTYIWHSTYTNNKIVLVNTLQNTWESETLFNITRIAFDFDGNGNPIICYEGSDFEGVKLNYLNSVTGTRHTMLFPNYRDVLIKLDWVKKESAVFSDLIMVAIKKPNILVCRVQEERFDVEHVDDIVLLDTTRLVNFGMTDARRLQIEILQ